MASSDLIAQPLNQQEVYNWVLLIELLVCGILYVDLLGTVIIHATDLHRAIFFLGYFDRLFGTLVSYGIRWYIWRTYHAYVDIQALQISLLGGRVFFKNIRYHAHNVSLHVHSGYITWHYWFRKVREAEVFSTDPPARRDTRSERSSPRSRSGSLGREEKAGSHGAEKSRNSFPCRLQAQVEGIQVFVYNRSPAYDAIVHSMSGTSERTANHMKKKISQDARSILESIKTALWQPQQSIASNGEKRAAGNNALSQKPALPLYLHLFPIEVRCKTAAAVLGNDNTRCILTVKADAASGVFDAGHSGPLDVYKQKFDFEFERAVINMKPNVDYKETQLATAARLKSGAPGPSAKERKRSQFWSKFNLFSITSRKYSASVRTASLDGTHDDGVPAFLPSAPGGERWRGLTRYLDDQFYDEHDEWDSIEYARSSTLVDCPRIGMTFYWDVPGTVPHSNQVVDEVPSPSDHDINGSSPPGYGMELRIHGGSITYGPWADRQRSNFQSVFFPPVYSDAVPGKKLLPGEPRVSTEFKIFVSVEAETIVRLPLRESSKDWKWKGRAETVAQQSKGPSKTKSRTRGRRTRFWRQRDKGTAGPTVRPFGWLDVKVDPNSTVTYVMDMIARENGYQSKVDADIRGLEMTSSVNHGLLWRSGPLSLLCDLAQPLGWNAPREWHFNIVNDDLKLFILRDHLFLLIDLIDDWSSGPPPEYFTFTPFRYLLDVHFRNFKLYLNTNDSNIINDPAALDDNEFMILFGKSLEGHVIIPIDKFRPIKNEIFFDVVLRNLGLNLCLNSRNTVAAFIDRKDVALLDEATIEGSYAYYSQTSQELTNRLTFFIHGKNLTFVMWGFVVAHLIKLKENYFGEHLHFHTLEEYQELSRGQQLGVTKVQQSKSSNELDVILCISADDVQAQLPANMYSSTDYIQADLPYASVDLRITSYYMDLQINFGPLIVSHNHSSSQESPQHGGSRSKFFIDSTAIVGHRLLGLPPTEPTYVCNWDIDVGNISGECSTIFLDKLVRAIRCFAFSLGDDENATRLIPVTIIHDVTFLRFRLHSAKIWARVQTDAFLVETAPITVEFNDWAGRKFSQRLKVVVPDVKLACLDAASASRRRAKGAGHIMVTHAYVQTSVVLSMLKRKLHFTAERSNQQRHLIEHDSRTNRTPFLVLPPDMENSVISSRLAAQPPALPFPPVPDPLINDSSVPIEHSTNSSAASGTRLSLGRESSASVLQKNGRSLRSEGSSRASSVKKGNERLAANSTVSEYVPKPQESVKGFDILLHDDKREHRGLPPSSVAFSSSVAPQSFPLHAAEPDISDLPPLPPKTFRGDTTPPLELNANTENTLDEDLTHTSLIVSVEPGIHGFCKPQAITAVANIIDALLPRSPETILDSFQIEVMTKLLDLEKKKEHGKGQSIEISLRIPSAAFRFFNVFPEDFQGKSEQAEINQCDLVLSQLAIMVRNRVYSADQSKKNISLLHCTLDSLQLLAKENPAGRLSQNVALDAQLDDILFWLSSSDSNMINVDFRDLEIATDSKQMGKLATAGHRVALLVEKYAARFADQQSARRRRLAYLVYNLTVAAPDVPDPPFITTASFASRAMSGHLRNHDSWKIISRFRFIYKSLPIQTRQNLINDCVHQNLTYPANAKSIVINSWDQWRTWDLAHVRKSYAMQNIYGAVPSSEGTSVENSPKTLQFKFRSSSIKLLVDPGLQQSEVSIFAPVIVLDIIPPPEPAGLMLIPSAKPTRKIVMQTGAQAFTMTLKWQIITLVESIIHVFKDDEKFEHLKNSPTVEAPASRNKEANECLEIQGVVVLDSTIITVETHNLNALLASKDLVVSLVGENNTADPRMSGSVLIHSAVSHSEFSSRSRPVLRAEAESPYLYMSQTRISENAKSSSALQVTAASRKVFVEGREEILGVIEIIDALIRDEVAYIRERLLVPVKAVASSSPRRTSSSSLPKITVALLMDSYRLDLALLQSLKYTMSGTLGRLSVSPNLDRARDLDMNFDFGEHSHDLTSKEHKDLHVISALKLPPINGHIKITRVNDAISISASMIIETIVLDASAVHGLLNTIQRPEVSKTFKAVQTDIETIKHRLHLIFPESSEEISTIDPVQSPSVFYDVAITLTGLKINADAPGKLPDAGVASLSFGLNCIQIKAFNAIEGGRIILPLPEIHAQLRQLFAELAITDSKGKRRCGNLSLSASVDCTLRKTRKGEKRNYRIQTDGIEINVFAETASAVVDVLNHLQDRIKYLDLSRERRYLQRLRQPRRKSFIQLSESMYTEDSTASSAIFTSIISVSLLNIQLSWIVGNSVGPIAGHENHDLVLSIKMIDLRTKSENSSRLTIEDLQLQMVPMSQSKRVRHMNSALLPEMVFNVIYFSTEHDRNMSFQAAGKSLDLQLEPNFIIPANVLQKSISLAIDKFRDASASWMMAPTESGAQRKNPFGDKRLSSLLVDTDFAGAVVHLQPSKRYGSGGSGSSTQPTRDAQTGRYGQFLGEDESSSVSLHSPGLAVRVEYKDNGNESSANAEVMISASSNTLTPTIVPLLLEMSESIQKVVGDTGKALSKTSSKPSQTFLNDDSLFTADPSALLGRTSLDLGLRIRSQEFSLSCQPIARVAATARIDDIYITTNNIRSLDHDHFFALSAIFKRLQVSVQHVYSRESTFSFEMESIALSVMNSKHLSGTAGIFAILKIYPTRTQINARQLQDFLLFRDIWYPPEIQPSSRPPTDQSTEPQEYFAQRYRQVATAAAFPWTATVSIADMSVEVDLGQAIGKGTLSISEMWASSKKQSNWEQNLCIGIGKMTVASTGRTSGSIEIDGFRVRTVIGWRVDDQGYSQTPLIQASAGFDRLRVKAAFDHQAFAIADISAFDFLMYNVKQEEADSKDRLVAILDGQEVQVFCTASSASQVLALYQAFERLVQENQAAYAQSLKDIEKFMWRQSVMPARLETGRPERSKSSNETDTVQAPISLYTDVDVTLKSINVGAFPGSFSDTQIFLLEASDVQARFAVTVEGNSVHSVLEMTLGQLSVALAAAAHPGGPKTLQEITVNDVVNTAKSARGGTILRVPKVIATMQTWQTPGSYHIDYIFKSSFEGKVDVGWNLARINFIRGMWNTHSRTLASRLGKPLPESAVKITTGPESPPLTSDTDKEHAEVDEQPQEKITAVVNMPQSKYDYTHLEPPIIETPQLRDMGEATPPLEWIGLHRDRLPHVTHQIVIVGLLGVAKEVGDAYGRILGSS